MVKIMFRCDGGQTPEIGTGHAARCRQIAAELDGHGDVQMEFLMQENEFARAFGKGMKWPARLFREGDQRGCEAHIRAFSPDVLVVDRLDSDPAFMKKAKGLCRVLATLDDTGPGAKEADIVINGIREGFETPYSGPRYAIVSPKISGLRKAGKECRRLFVSMGGYDHQNLTLKVARALEKLDPEKEVVLALGTAYPFGADLEGFLKTAKRKFTVRKTPEDYVGLLCGSDVAVTNGGLSFFEAMAAGVPTLALAQYGHQAETARRFDALGAAEFIGMGNEAGNDEILERVSRLVYSLRDREALSRRAQGEIDGDGLARGAGILRVVQHKKWDSNFFGMKIATLNVSRMNGRIAAFAEEWCRKNSVACLFYLCDCNHAESVRVAEAQGYGFKDIRIALEIGMEKGAPPAAQKSPETEIRECREEDLPEIKEIAKKSYSQSRYYFDGHFEPDKLEKFYSDWLENTFKSPLGRVFVASDKSGKAFGYVSAEIDNRGRLGRIILVGVEGNRARTGAGQQLVSAVLSWMHEKKVYVVEVVTQGRNIGAQRLYHKCGFRIASLSLWYHKWF